MIIIYCISDFLNIYHTNEGMNSIEPPNELRNHVHLRNLALIHVALITSLMQRIADLSSPTTDTMGPDAEYTVHTNFTPNRTLLQTPIKLTL